MSGAIQSCLALPLPAKASHSYGAHSGTCQSRFVAAIHQSGITGYKSVGNFLFGGSKRDMQSAIMQQPVSGGIEADQYAPHAYRLVVLTSGCGTSRNHGALAAGYGAVNGLLPEWKLAGAFHVSVAAGQYAVRNHAAASVRRH